ncbi:MAG: hypothetical protein PUA90_00270 [bacterium]|nr:hypothetical protein [bacterium]
MKKVENIKLDNKIKIEDIELNNKINNKKKELDIVFEEIKNQKIANKKYDELEEDFSRIKKNLSEAMYYLGYSIKGKRINNVIQNMDEKNQIIYRKVINSIDDKKKDSKNKIKQLYEQTEILTKELKEISLPKNQVKNDEKDEMNKK